VWRVGSVIVDSPVRPPPARMLVTMVRTCILEVVFVAGAGGQVFAVGGDGDGLHAIGERGEIAGDVAKTRATAATFRIGS
jgi:hypothetical protein